ncbi:phage tail tape measure protein [Micrococcus sp.]|uniref:phage tail tape measure protein n=1 Tax=Micrococcus sp. TaxID=1271 RepID=UPI002A908B86|nr:phage tail tape measure protein [Micrococcus sp.]MDY6054340.1 phage tail tape measure protein [Micrococcus sp.]
MADRRVKVIVEAEVAGYRRAMDEAAQSTRKVKNEADMAAKGVEGAASRSAKASEKVAAAQKASADAWKRHSAAAADVAAAQKKLDQALASKNAEAAASAAKDLSDAQAKLKVSAADATAAQKALDDAMSKQGASLSRAVGFAREYSAELERVGGVLTGAGAGLLGLAVASGKAAMDWESAWAGVAKTNDGTTEQLTALEQGLRDMTGVLPASHAEIAAVAEAAGQLGVGIEDVQSFTKVMIDLGESTNLSAEEAATALARFANIMGTSLSDVDRLGSVIVGLGNSFATTESEIVGMSMRLAGVGQQMGMTEGDVMGLAAAMSSVGIEAEAGGTAMSTVMKKIDADVRAGGKNLQGWANAAGVSAAEFAEAWKGSPAQAIDMLVSGLGEAGAAGEDMNATLADLGVKGIRESDTLIRLAGASGLVGEAVAAGNEAWEANSALIAEASKRYETAESKIRIAWNRIKDTAITAGGAILPAVAGIAGAVADTADFFAQLPAPVQKAMGLISGVGGAAAVAAGSFLMLAPRVVDTWDAARRLSGSVPALSRGMDAFAAGAEKAAGKVGGLGKALGGIATAGAVGIGIGSLVSTGELAEVDSVTAALINLSGEAEAAALGIEQLDSAFMGKGNWFDGLDVSGIEEAFRIIGNPDVGDNVDQITSKILTFGTRGSTNMEFVRKNFEQLDDQLATMANGGSAAAAAQSFELIAQKAEAAGVPSERLAEIFPSYTAAMTKAAAEGRDLAMSVEDLGEAADDATGGMDAVAEASGRMSRVDESSMAGITAAMGALADESLEASEKLDAVLDSLMAMGIVEQTAIQATMGYKEALDGLSGAYEENGRTLDINTEAGRANMNAILGVAAAGRELVDANARAGESQGVLRENLLGTYQDLVRAAEGFGATAGEADRLARQLLGIPEGVDIHTAMDDAAYLVASATGEAVEALPNHVGVTVAVSEEGTAGSVQERINGVTGKTETIFVTDDGSIVDVQQRIVNVAGIERTVWVDDAGTIYGTQQEIDAIRDTDVLAEVKAVTGRAETDITHTARDRVTSVSALADVWAAEEKLGKLARPRSMSITANVVAGIGGRLLKTALAAGGRVPALASGGRLPHTGLGTDQILGISSKGVPTAWVDDREWVINRKSSDRYDRVLGLINRDDPSIHHLRGLADGGRQGREWSAASLAPRVTVQPPASVQVIDYERLGQVAARAAASLPVHVVLDGRKVGAGVRMADWT